ncbi:MAG TPA: hypothetical protein VMI94_20890 [Bryobacteraceae bacterium]|nr:hypothetical protein [Bryobacteraceae bacterium]
MAALIAILKALRHAVGRDLGTFESITVNNLFLFVALLCYGALNSGQPPHSAEPFFVLLGFLLLFPLSADPLGRIPPSRLSLWPLTTRQRLGLRLGSLALSPVTWVGLLILWRTARPTLALAFLALAAAIQAAAALARYAVRHNRHWDVLRDIPVLPGRLGGLVRKDLRQMLSVLDPYAAALLSLGGGLYRAAGRHADPVAFSILSLLVALSLSTYGQSLFGLDIGSGITRYRLLPLPGWQLLLAKDLAFLTLLLVLLSPLDPGPGMTLGFAALAAGHHSSVLMEIPHQRWRFTGGRLLPVGALQAMGGMALGFLESARGPVVLLLTAVAWLVSLWFYGRRWDARSTGAHHAL